MTDIPKRFLNDRLALVTGGSRNLGAATSQALAEAGAVVAVNYHRSADEAFRLVESLPHSPSGHLAVQGDAGTPDGIRRLVDNVEQKAGGRPIEILINNFGPFSMTPFTEMPEDEWERIWSANVKAAFVAVQETAPKMDQAGWGRIVNVSAGSAYLRNHSIYTLAKDAVVGLTESLAVELGPSITVNAVTPGQIAESADDIIRLAEVEGLDAHAKSVKIRQQD